MARTDLWKYCSAEQCREMMLSFRLIGARDWPPEKNNGLSLCPQQSRGKTLPKGEHSQEKRRLQDPAGAGSLLKNVQRNLLHHVLDGFTVSDSAAAYRKGASVAANAGMHQGRKIVMKMDIEDFLGASPFPWCFITHFRQPIFLRQWVSCWPPFAAAMTVCPRERLRPRPSPIW